MSFLENDVSDRASRKRMRPVPVRRPPTNNPQSVWNLNSEPVDFIPCDIGLDRTHRSLEQFKRTPQTTVEDGHEAKADAHSESEKVFGNAPGEPHGWNEKSDPQIQPFNYGRPMDRDTGSTGTLPKREFGKLPTNTANNPKRACFDVPVNWGEHEVEFPDLPDAATVKNRAPGESDVDEKADGRP